MAFFDFSLDHLQLYKPDLTAPDDFAEFWQNTLAEARQHDINATFTPVDAGLKLVDVYDVTYAGYGGQPVKGWYLRPKGVSEKLPVVVEYLGYGGGRGLAHQRLLWPTAGYAYMVMDTRGQGSAWSKGDTTDLIDGGNPFHPGFMTQGILDPKTYYYRRVFTDAVRAIDAVKTRDDVDASRIAATGISQGGGITIAVSGLIPGDIKIAMADVPFICNFERAIGLTNADPYQEIVRYLTVHREKADQVYQTLRYFDAMNHAANINADSLFSTSLMDEVCPPSTVFAAYNQVSAPKDIRVYRFNGHEGGGVDHEPVKLAFVRERWG